jgi:nucleotide-binding universal stress UspA family protein
MDDVDTQAAEPAAPFRRVIVGVDERRGADAASLAQHLVAGGGSLVLAHVCVHNVHDGGDAEPVIGQRERRRVHALLATVLDDLRLNAELACVGARSVGRGLHQLAIAERADLVVIGSCRRAALGRVMISEPTSKALSGAPGAIAIAPRGYAMHPAPLQRIGLAYDASPDSRNALAVARALARTHAASLSAFLAVATADAVDQARARITALGDVEPHAGAGDPAEELARYSGTVDLLVVGSRGEDPIGRLAHGSTGRYRAATAHCPLLVLTHDAPARAPDRLENRIQPTARATGA